MITGYEGLDFMRFCEFPFFHPTFTYFESTFFSRLERNVGLQMLTIYIYICAFVSERKIYGLISLFGRAIFYDNLTLGFVSINKICIRFKGTNSRNNADR